MEEYLKMKTISAKLTIDQGFPGPPFLLASCVFFQLTGKKNQTVIYCDPVYVRNVCVCLSAYMPLTTCVEARGQPTYDIELGSLYLTQALFTS